MMSVPPLEEPILKRTVDPRAGRAMAKASSSRGWLVKGPSMGITRSSSTVTREVSRLQYTVRSPKETPRKAKPTTRSAQLNTITSVPGVTKGSRRPRMMERPLTPPVEKLLGNLNTYTPTVTNRVPKVSRAKSFTRFIKPSPPKLFTLAISHSPGPPTKRLSKPLPTAALWVVPGIGLIFPGPSSSFCAACACAWTRRSASSSSHRTPAHRCSQGRSSPATAGKGAGRHRA